MCSRTGIEGRKRAYLDAEIIAEFIQSNKVKVSKIKFNKKTTLGVGETAAIELARKIKATLIVSDDVQFAKSTMILMS